MRRLLPGLEAARWTELAAVAAAFPNAQVLLRRLAAAADIESLRDYLAELRYALVFRSIGCQVSWEPDGSAGPDLLVGLGDDAFAVEVARFRAINDGPPPVGDLLEPYGNLERDIAKSITKISGKLRQIGDHRGIVALWNDDDALEELEVGTAARELRESRQLPPERLVGVVYGSEWIGCQQLFWFPIAKQADLAAEALGERLSRVSVSDVLGLSGGAISRNGLTWIDGAPRVG